MPEERRDANPLDYRPHDAAGRDIESGRTFGCAAGISAGIVIGCATAGILFTAVNPVGTWTVAMLAFLIGASSVWAMVSIIKHDNANPGSDGQRVFRFFLVGLLLIVGTVSLMIAIYCGSIAPHPGRSR